MMTISSCLSQHMNVFLIFSLIPIPQITPQMQLVPFSCVSYDSYVEKATAIITEGMTESQLNLGCWAG